MAPPILLTCDAKCDLKEILDYISANENPRKAPHVTNQIKKTLESLTEMADRGSHPREFLVLGIREYREVFFKPYRIIYRVQDNGIYVLLIADGRRDMQSLLQQRLLQA